MMFKIFKLVKECMNECLDYLPKKATLIKDVARMAEILKLKKHFFLMHFEPTYLGACPFCCNNSFELSGSTGHSYCFACYHSESLTNLKLKLIKSKNNIA